MLPLYEVKIWMKSPSVYLLHNEHSCLLKCNLYAGTNVCNTFWYYLYLFYYILKCPSKHNVMCPLEQNFQKLSFRTWCYVCLLPFHSNLLYHRFCLDWFWYHDKFPQQSNPPPVAVPEVAVVPDDVFYLPPPPHSSSGHWHSVQLSVLTLDPQQSPQS